MINHLYCRVYTVYVHQNSMSFYLLFYGLVLFFYDYLAVVGSKSLIGLSYFRRVQQQIGTRQAHWLLRSIACLLIIAGLSVRYHHR